MQANAGLINKIHAQIVKVRGKNGTIALSNAINLMTKESKLGLSEKDAYYCFGMSKMTVKDENEGGIQKYNVPTRAEFYEFIARAAALKFHDYQGMTLMSKIEKVLDYILPVYGYTRINIDWEALEDGHYSSSDDSVDFSHLETKTKLFYD